MEKYFPEVIKALNVKEVTITEINKMNPRKIEELFASFAGDYFTRLKLYGWMGSGIGGFAELLAFLSQI